MMKSLLIGVFAAVAAFVALLLTRPEHTPRSDWPPPGTWVAFDDYVPNIPATRPAPRPEVPLDNVIEKLSIENRTIREAYAILASHVRGNMVVDWREVESLGVDLETTINLSLVKVSAETALRTLNRHVARGVDFWNADGVVTVTADERAIEYTLIKTYNIRDIVLEGQAFERRLLTSFPDKAPPRPGGFRPAGAWEEDSHEVVRELIESTVDPASWQVNGGRFGNIGYWAGKLFVVQTPENHNRIADVLAMLRQREPEAEGPLISQ